MCVCWLQDYLITLLLNPYLLYPISGPEWPSGLVARSSRRRPGFDSRSVGLSEINFSDLYCGWLGRNIHVEYNTIQYNTTHYNWGAVVYGYVRCLAAVGLRVRIHLKAAA